MNTEKRFSVGHGLAGCLVSWLCMAVLILLISLVLFEWLELISYKTERISGVFIWLFAICLGGYFAARLGKTTGWTNSLVVGVFAELFVVAVALGERDAGNDVNPTSLGPFLANPKYLA